MPDRRRYRPRYTDAVEWIAGNDEPLVTDVDVVAGAVSVCLVADLWGKRPFDVALDVVGVRTGQVSLRLYRAAQRRKG